MLKTIVTAVVTAAAGVLVTRRRAPHNDVWRQANARVDEEQLREPETWESGP